MNCKYCFASFKDQNGVKLHQLPKENAIAIVHELGKAGFRKISIVGGEPTLYPHLVDLLVAAKQWSMKTMIVTNGWLINKKFLFQYSQVLDWIALSVDSLEPEINKAIGRTHKGVPISYSRYFGLVDDINKYGYKLKLNTVVSRFNKNDDIMHLVQHSRTTRWKIMQVKQIDGQNSQEFKNVEVSDLEFVNYHHNMRFLHSNPKVIETADDMTNTYVMVDPSGRFVGNSKGVYTYSSPILEVGAKAAYKEMGYDYDRFVGRKGLYS
jgi:radical S-adenosyl methionine domain-containing protein 2